MKSLVTIAVLFFLAPTSVVAQESSLGTYLHGRWTIKGTAEGKEVAGTMNVSPSANGESQMYRWTIKYPDEVRYGSAIGGIDPDSGKIVEHGFGKDFYWKTTYEEILGDSVSKTTGTRVGTVKGESFEGRISVVRESEDQFQYDVESDNAGDAHLIFTRVKDDSDGAAAFKAYAELAVGGTWTTTVDGVTYEDTYEQLQEGQFVMLSSKPAGNLPAAVTILGVDPSTGKFTWWGFGADGTYSFGTSKQTKAGVWVGPWNSNGPNGSMTSRGKLTRRDDDTIKYEILEQTKDDEVPGFAPVSIWKRKR